MKKCLKIQNNTKQEENAAQRETTKDRTDVEAKWIYVICTLNVETLFLVEKCLDEACQAGWADITQKWHTKLSM